MTCEVREFKEEIFIGDEISIQFEIYKWDTSVCPHVENGVDISDAIAQEITFLKPDEAATKIERAGSFLTDGTDFISKYKTDTTDLDTAGLWFGQNKITLPSGVSHTSKISFVVLEPL